MAIDTTIKTQKPPSPFATADILNTLAKEGGQLLPERTFFTNLEQILERDKIRTMRGEARSFMPIRDQVLVILCEKDEETQSGIIIPGTAQERPSEGIVIAVGPGRVDANNVFRPTIVRPEDRVLFNRYSGRDWEIRGRKCRLLIEDQIEGVIR